MNGFDVMLRPQQIRSAPRLSVGDLGESNPKVWYSMAGRDLYALANVACISLNKKYRSISSSQTALFVCQSEGQSGDENLVALVHLGSRLYSKSNLDDFSRVVHSNATQTKEDWGYYLAYSINDAPEASTASDINIESPWLTQIRRIQSLDGTRKIYGAVIRHVHAERKLGRISQLAADLASIETRMYEPAALMAFLRSTFPIRSKLPSWGALLRRTRVDLLGRDLDAEEYLQGMKE